jgi:hypothetical protein
MWALLFNIALKWHFLDSQRQDTPISKLKSTPIAYKNTSVPCQVLQWNKLPVRVTGSLHLWSASLHVIFLHHMTLDQKRLGKESRSRGYSHKCQEIQESSDKSHSATFSQRYFATKKRDSKVAIKSEVFLLLNRSHRGTSPLFSRNLTCSTVSRCDPWIHVRLLFFPLLSCSRICCVCAESRLDWGPLETVCHQQRAPTRIRSFRVSLIIREARFRILIWGIEESQMIRGKAEIYVPTTQCSCGGAPLSPRPSNN